MTKNDSTLNPSDYPRFVRDGKTIALCTCLKCGKKFELLATDLKRGRGKYCSRQCFGNTLVSVIQRQCANCNCSFLVNPAKKQKYCSRECYRNRKQTVVECTCEHCHKTFEIAPSVKKQGSGKYCSKACRNISKREKQECVCLHCGAFFFQFMSLIVRGSGKYCSQKCYKASHLGINHPRWRGGHSKNPGYGPNWLEQKGLAYERDGGICQRCRRKPKQGERRFHVHHIVKRRDFSGDYVAANDLRNLITLCPSCHPKAEIGKITVPMRLF